MKNKKQLTIDNVKVGQRIKMALPRGWAQTPYNKHYSKGNYCWVKGKVSVIKDKSILVNTRYKWHKRCIHSFLQSMFCIAEENGEYNMIYIQK